jgi:hypothetical protein
MPRPLRSDVGVLRLFVKVAEDALTSPALQTDFTLTMRFDQQHVETTFDEPALRDKRDLLVVIRKLDQKSHDAYLPKVYEAIDRIGVRDEWRLGLAGAREAYAKGHDVGDIRVQIPGEPPRANPTWMLPRRAWELWLDGEVIHDDFAKQSEWESLGPAEGPVRQMAYDYLTMLLTQAAFLSRMIRLGLAMAIDLPSSPPGLGRGDELA